MPDLNNRKPTVPASSIPVKGELARSCSKCFYALHTATGRCSNPECGKSYRSSSALTSEQLLNEYAPLPLFHGRRWGSWTLDTERLCLVYGAFPVSLGDGSGRTAGVPPYTAFWGDYEIDLEPIRDSAAMLDWIFQIRGKGWASGKVLKDLLNAFDAIFHPQANLCSGHCHKIIKNPKAFLQNRFEAVAS